MSITQNLLKIKSSLPENVTLVAVSKTKPVADFDGIKNLCYAKQYYSIPIRK